MFLCEMEHFYEAHNVCSLSYQMINADGTMFNPPTLDPGERKAIHHVDGLCNTCATHMRLQFHEKETYMEYWPSFEKAYGSLDEDLQSPADTVNQLLSLSDIVKDVDDDAF